MKRHLDCTCEEEEIEEHTCPYATEINDDYDFLCTCCDECCTYQCAQDV